MCVCEGVFSKRERLIVYASVHERESKYMRERERERESARGSVFALSH